MKKLTAIAIVILICVFASLAWASDEQENTGCDAISKIAGSIMSQRQMVDDILEMLKVQSEITDSEIVKSIVIRAYQKPRYSGSKYRERAIKAFKTEIYLECYHSINGG